MFDFRSIPRVPGPIWGPLSPPGAQNVSKSLVKRSVKVFILILILDSDPNIIQAPGGKS